MRRRRDLKTWVFNRRRTDSDLYPSSLHSLADRGKKRKRYFLPSPEI